MEDLALFRLIRHPSFATSVFLNDHHIDGARDVHGGIDSNRSSEMTDGWSSKSYTDILYIQSVDIVVYSECLHLNVNTTFCWPPRVQISIYGELLIYPSYHDSKMRKMDYLISHARVTQNKVFDRDTYAPMHKSVLIIVVWSQKVREMKLVKYLAALVDSNIN